MTIESQLVNELQDLKPEVGREVAEDWKEQAEENLRDEDQGANLLVEGQPDDAPMSWPVEGFFTDVEQVGDRFEFKIQHPTAPLHEYGGHIEPTYAEAMAMGWTRDGFYSALQDCEEWVYEKRYMRDAAQTIRRRYK